MSKTTTLNFVFINAGRGTREQVRKVWRTISNLITGRNKEKVVVDFVIAVEVDEGDKGYSDSRFIRRFIEKYLKRSNKGGKEVILFDDTKWREIFCRRIEAGAGVKRWSPPRPVTVGLYQNKKTLDRVRIIAAHPAAGANRQAKNRPENVRKPLQKSWEATIRKMLDEIYAGVGAGNLTFCFTDGNTRNLMREFGNLMTEDRRALHHVELFDKAPDFGYQFYPHPSGVSKVEVDHKTFPNPIEPKLHPGHRVRVTTTIRD